MPLPDVNKEQRPIPATVMLAQKNQTVNKDATAHYSEVRYRVVVGGLGVVFDGYSSSEGQMQFQIFVGRSKAAKSRLTAGSVLLFQDEKVIREFHPFLITSEN
jgi:hypothetical protein